MDGQLPGRQSSTKMSSLTVGRGEITKNEENSKLELHLNMTDYSNLITQRTRPNALFSIVHVTPDQTTQSHVTEKRGKTTVLPKTYVTRAGPLFLYSDSKIMKDNQEAFSKVDDLTDFHIKGEPVVNQRDTYPAWGKLISKHPVERSPRSQKGNLAKREQRTYLTNRKFLRIPYTGNYAITPVRVVNKEDEEAIQTVKSLSDAALSFHQKETSENDRYIRVMSNAWIKKQPEVDIKFDPSGKRRVSKSMREWMIAQTTADDKMTKSANLPEMGDMEQLQRARTTLNLSSRLLNSRAPTNTPMTGIWAVNEDKSTQENTTLKSCASSETPLHLLRQSSAMREYTRSKTFLTFQSPRIVSRPTNKY